MINTAGIERLQAFLLTEIYKNIEKYDAVPKKLEECMILQDVLNRMSIGQLLTMAHLEDRWKSFKVNNIDTEGTVYVTTAGMFGGMDLEGFIHT